MHPRIIRPFLCQQLVYRRDDPHPHRPALRVACLHQLVGAHSHINMRIADINRRVLAVLPDQEVGGSQGDAGTMYKPSPRIMLPAT